MPAARGGKSFSAARSGGVVVRAPLPFWGSRRVAARVAFWGSRCGSRGGVSRLGGLRSGGRRGRGVGVRGSGLEVGGSTVEGRVSRSGGLPRSRAGSRVLGLALALGVGLMLGGLPVSASAVLALAPLRSLGLAACAGRVPLARECPACAGGFGLREGVLPAGGLRGRGVARRDRGGCAPVWLTPVACRSRSSGARVARTQLLRRRALARPHPLGAARARRALLGLLGGGQSMGDRRSPRTRVGSAEGSAGMPKWQREVRQAVEQVEGVVRVQFAEGGKHLRLRVEGSGGVERVVVVSRTPSCHRTLRNGQRDVRRALRA